MPLVQEKVVRNLDSLTSCTVNFPSLIAQAEAVSVITRMEKDTILKKYKSLYDKLTTFYLLISSKGPEALEKLSDLLEHTGNHEVIDILNNESPLPDMDADLLSHQKLILENIDRLCSHTMNPSLVLCFATGIELVCGKEREIIASEFPSELDQLEAFYALVASKGEDAFEKLVQVLRLTSNYWALEVLELHD